MRAYVFTALIFFLFQSWLQAEGPPVNRKTGEVTVPHTIITLNDSQQEELDTLGSVTFTPDQWASLRKVSNTCPKRIGTVIPVDYNDCTCGLDEEYAIAVAPDRLAVLHNEWRDSSLVWFFSSRDMITLRVDRRGQFYYEGALVPYRSLLESVRVTAEQRKESDKETNKVPYLYAEIPIGLTRESVTLKERIDELYELAEAGGWETPNKYRD